MPEFYVIPSSEVKAKWIRPGRRPHVRDQYVAYIQRLKPDDAGKLVLSDDENPATIRGRLYRAAKSIRVNLQVRRINNEIFFRRQREDYNDNRLTSAPTDPSAEETQRVRR